MAFSKMEAYSFSVLWSIDNVAYCPFKTREMLSSPFFKVESLGASEWRLVLFPRGALDTEYTSLYLHRKPGVRPDLVTINVNLRLSVDCNAPDLCLPIVARNISFREDDYWGFPRFTKVDYLHRIASTSLTRLFTVRCELSPSDEVAIDIATDSRLDLRALSMDLKHLYQSQKLSDVVLKCDGAEFKTHRAVLVARSPKFFKRLIFDGPVADVSFMSRHVLKTLLSYFYSGELDLPGSEIPRGLLTIAEDLELPDLMKKMETHPSVCYARSVLNVEHKSVLWVVKRIGEHESETSFVRFLPTPSLYVEHLLLSCQVISDSDRGPFKEINVSLNLSDLKKNQPVYVKCKILGTGTDQTLWELLDVEHVFETDEEWCLSIPVEMDPIPVLPNVTSLCFELSLCDGMSYSRVQDDWSTLSQRSSSAFQDFTHLSHDLKRLQTSPDLFDVLVVCTGWIFQAHRAILAARSPVFDRMFEHNLVENQQRLVRVPDVPSETMRQLLSYMYAGRVSSNLTYEDASDLYEAADKYAIIALKEKCGAILLDTMGDHNAESLLKLADMHFDSVLKEQVTSFMERNLNSTSEQDSEAEDSESIV